MPTSQRVRLNEYRKTTRIHAKHAKGVDHRQLASKSIPSFIIGEAGEGKLQLHFCGFCFIAIENGQDHVARIQIYVEEESKCIC